MEAKEFVDSLFKGYEETPALADFKEELLGNLNAKIEDFVKKGMEPEAAFAKASAELGDVSALADELSLKKRTEVFEEAYMGIRRYMSAGRVAAYVVFGAVALFGIITGLMDFFSQWNWNSVLNLRAVFDSMMPFLTAAAVGLTWLGVTQETASMYPLSKKRAAWYAAGAGLITFGFLIMLGAFFSKNDRLVVSGENFVLDGGSLEILLDENSVLNSDKYNVIGAIYALIPFVLPGIGILVFLVLTEKDRLKPWAKDFRDKTVAREMAMWQDPATATRFGMFSGAIWISATGLFFLLGFLIGFKFSWLIFIFATAFQLVVQGLMSKREN